MAARISEAEFAALKKKASKQVVFSDAPRRTSAGRSARSRRRDRTTSFRDLWPTLAAIGGVAALGFIASRQNSVHGLGVVSPDQQQNAQIGSALGSAIGAVTGIPGLGALGSVIGSLFGPSVHTDPMGIPQDQVQGEFNTIAQEMFVAINQHRLAMGMQSIAFPPTPVSGTSAMYDWTSSIMAEVLYEPALKTTSPDMIAQYRENGTMDAAIAAIQTIIKGLEMPPVLPAPAPPSYGAVTGSAAPAPPSSYQSQTATTNSFAPPPTSATSSIMAWVQANPVLAAGGALVLVLLLTSGAESAPIIVGGRHA